jgi:hypothetical protein
MLPKHVSKKALALVAGCLLVFLGQYLGVEIDEVEEIVKLIMAYLVGQGLADFSKEKKETKQ